MNRELLKLSFSVLIHSVGLFWCCKRAVACLNYRLEAHLSGAPELPSPASPSDVLMLKCVTVVLSSSSRPSNRDVTADITSEGLLRDSGWGCCRAWDCREEFCSPCGPGWLLLCW